MKLVLRIYKDFLIYSANNQNITSVETGEVKDQLIDGKCFLHEEMTCYWIYTFPESICHHCESYENGDILSKL